METDFMQVEPALELKEWKWTDCNLKRIADVKKVVFDLEQYWPISARKVYYDVISLPWFNDAPYWKSQSKKRSLNGLPLKNTDSIVCELLKWSRLYCEESGLDSDEAKDDSRAVPMEAINDDGRQIGGKVGFSSSGQFFRQQIKDVFHGYTSCLAQNQERYIEVWIEKRGLFHIVEPISRLFCRRTLAVRGYPSVTVLNDYANRAWEQKNPTILYFGDLDIDGIKIPETFLKALLYEHGLPDVDVIRCGLNPKQVKYLKASNIPLKGSPREKSEFARKYGDKAYEMDAMKMPDFEQLVWDSLAAHTDMEILEADKQTGNKDRAKFNELQTTVESFASQQAKEAGLLF